MTTPPALQAIEDWPDGVFDRNGRELEPGYLVRVLGHDGGRSHNGHVVSCQGAASIVLVWQDDEAIAPHHTMFLIRIEDDNGRPRRIEAEENDEMAKKKTSTKNGASKPRRSRKTEGTEGTRGAEEFQAEDHPVFGGEQSIIPGAETPENPEIEKVAKDLDKAKRNYAAWGRTAGVLNERLVSLMKGEDLEHYWRNGVEVSIKASDPKEKAEVTVER